MTAEVLIDLTVPVQRQHYSLIVDDRLAHQLRIVWGLTRATIAASCNCGVVVGEGRPQDEPLPRLKAAYDAHVRGLP
jgi:hypothetical protein